MQMVCAASDKHVLVACAVAWLEAATSGGRIYGSFSTGLASPTSDLDYVITANARSMEEMLYHLAEHLTGPNDAPQGFRWELCHPDTGIVASSAGPLLKLVLTNEDEQELSVDISCNGPRHLCAVTQ